MSKKLFVAALLMVLALMLLPSGCTPGPANPPVSQGASPAPPLNIPPQDSFPVVVTDMLGRQIRLERAPEKLVSLAPSNTEILFAIGMGDKVVGVTQYCDYPEEAKNKSKIGGYSTADIEKVVSLSPDLILTTRIHEKEVVPALERVGLKTFGLNPRTVDAVLDSVTLVGTVTGQVSAGDRLVKELKTRISAVTSKTDGIPPEKRPKVLYVNWSDPIKTAGRDTFADDLIRKAGGVNVAADLSGYSTVSLESIVARNPQVIIISGMGTERKNTYNAIMSDARLSGIEARLKGRVYEIESATIERPGPRLVLALEQVAKFLHPEMFGKL